MKEISMAKSKERKKGEARLQDTVLGRILIAATVLAGLICAAMFTFMGVYMSSRSQSTMDSVSDQYMGSIGDHEAKRFETAIGLRLEQVCSLARAMPPDGVTGMEQIIEGLVHEAKARDFAYLAFYDGSEYDFENTEADYNGGACFNMLDGSMSQIGLDDPLSFHNSIMGLGTEKENKIAVGKDAEGNAIIIFGVVGKGVRGQTSEDWRFDVNYPLTNGDTADALVAGVPVEYLETLLRLDDDASHKDEGESTYSHIIRRDGSYVIRSGEVEEGDNYFDRVYKEVLDRDAAAAYIERLKDSMQRDMHYSTALATTSSEELRIHCCHLAYSEWQLLTVMRSDHIRETVKGLNTTWNVISIAMAVTLVVVLLALFAVYLVFNKRNMTEIKEARLVAENANKAKSEFLSSMSHDIRTPMNAIVGMTAIATANIDDKQQVRNCLKKITLSSKHLLGLINDVLDMSKIESGKMTLNMEHISLKEVLDGISIMIQPQIKTKRQKFGITVGNIIEENVYCDSVRLNQVLLNLLSNAIKFTPEEGSINMSLSEEVSPHSENFVRVHIRVKDSGIGMSKEFQKKIFESFVREDNMRVHKTEGAGLGMAITKHIVEAMSGEIEVESELGKGTEFHVTLDLEKVEDMELDMVLPNWNMLVVDDDRQLCETAVVSLREIGVNAEWTLSSEEAVKKAVERHDRRDDYNVVLMDWKLPGMDGIETAKELHKKLGDDIPILLISAYDWSDIEEEARAAGIRGFIAKPLFKSTLYYGLKKYTDGGEQVAAETTKKEVSLDGMNILLAEDNDLNWEIAETLLTSEGAKVTRAENGQICVDIFDSSAVGEYDAILMDIRMPVMTGYEAAARIRALDKEDKDIPIIAMTADAFADDIKHCLTVGMNAHIAKPIDMDRVKTILAKFIDVNRKGTSKQ